MPDSLYNPTSARSTATEAVKGAHRLLKGQAFALGILVGALLEWLLTR